MAVKFKDYDPRLGVPRTATEAEINRAYRQLARKHHSDRNPQDKTAEETCKAINEAYTVLSDPEKRQRDAQLGPNWQAGADFTPPPGWEHGWARFGDLLGRGRDRDGFSDFFETLFGGVRGRRAGPGIARRDLQRELDWRRSRL